MNIVKGEGQPRIDISKTTPVLTSSGGKIWLPGVILRKVNRFVTGTDHDMLVPIDIFYDPETMEVLTDGLPQEIKNLLEDEKTN